MTDVCGVGPIIAAQIIRYSGDICRFVNRDAYASYNGTAPAERSSGGRVVHRVSMRGSRKLNHAVHMAAVTQIRQNGSRAGPTSIARSPKARRRGKRVDP